jgi:hypothetical protein
MPYKDASIRKLKFKEYSRKHYEANKEKIKKKASEYKQIKRKEWSEFKAKFKCANCGFSHPAAMDFHHVDKTDYKSIYLLSKNSSYKEAMEEIKKCIPLCANCHRIHHHNEKLDKKRKAKKKASKKKSRP